MNGKIDKDGFLHIERAGKMKLQMCPFVQTANTQRQNWACGDWCPLFGEAYPVHDGEYAQKELHLCHSCVYFDTLTDERGK